LTPPPSHDRSANEKAFAARLLELKAAALSPECVALLAGLDLTRDIASHFAQVRRTPLAGWQ
jgi:hypothetical protein